MWKFKSSKYKNAAPKIPKKEEWLNDVTAANLLNSCGNHIQASRAYTVFNTDIGGGSCLGILPLDARGRQSGGIPTIHAHSGFVTDFSFSPFDDYLLATGSQDCTVNIWKLPEHVAESHNTPLLTLTKGEKRIENVLWHPSAQDILAVTCHTSIDIYNVATEQQVYGFEAHGDVVQSVSWKSDGSMMATSCRDKQLRLIDPRTASVAQETIGHQNIKDSRVIWLGNKEQILTSGFDRMRQREVSLRDCRNLGSPLSTKSMDTATGVLMPLYDADTGMLFMAGVGDTCIRYLEVTDKEIIENCVDTVEQVKGLALVPKAALDVMQCEVDRLMLLSMHTLMPVPYHVPRKSYTDFHEDLFPDIDSDIPAMTAQEWCDGRNATVSKVSINPGMPAVAKVTSAGPATPAVAKVTSPSPVTPDAPKVASPSPVMPVVAKDHTASEPGMPGPRDASPDIPVSVKPSQVLPGKKAKPFAGVRQAKFRHLTGTTSHRSECIENLRNISQNMPGESDMFHANVKFCAVPLGGAGGLIAILNVTTPGRLPDTGVPALQNGSKVADFAWDPFDNHRLAVACDDAKIRVWRIPEDGLTETLTEPEVCLIGHTEKVYFVHFHPMASDILASSSYDKTVRIWSLATETEELQLTGHTDSVLCFAWSADGQRCATVCKDGRVRLFEPRTSPEPIREAPGPEGTRGARCVWTLDGTLLAVTGFDRMSGRQVSVYDTKDLTAPLYTVDLDTSPAILIPHYDEDSSTLFVTGRGDTTVRTFEVVPDHPHLVPLSDYKPDGLHQALAFLPKTACDVRKLEFARALRLTRESIEPVAFTVPRVKQEFFQDDLFPDTKVTWEPVMTGAEWLSGTNRIQKTISLRPPDMTPLSEMPTEAPAAKKYDSFQHYQEHHKTEDEKKEELLSAMVNKLGERDDPLPQDLTEGVDPDEWSD